MLFIYSALFAQFILLIFSIVLLVKKSPVKRANRILALNFILMMAYSFLSTYMLYAANNQSFILLSYYYPINLVIAFLLGPCIYFYVRLLMGHSVSFLSWHTWRHTLSTLPAWIYLIYFSTLPATNRVALLLSDFYHTSSWPNWLLHTAFYFQLIVYVLICLRLVCKQQKLSYQIEINNTQIDIHWLCLLFRIDLGLLITAIPILIWQQNEYVNSLLEPLVIDTIVFYLFIKSILQTGLFMQTGVEMLKPTDHTLKIADEVVDNYLEILFSAMEKDKVYLKEGCTMEDVVANTGIPKHHLSCILNTNLQKSFADFINEYRIRHACLLLTSNKHQHLTLEALGHECGFGSKTSFNRAFKKHANQTPSAFQLANKQADR